MDNDSIDVAVNELCELEGLKLREATRLKIFRYARRELDLKADSTIAHLRKRANELDVRRLESLIGDHLLLLAAHTRVGCEILAGEGDRREWRYLAELISDAAIRMEREDAKRATRRRRALERS